MDIEAPSVLDYRSMPPPMLLRGHGVTGRVWEPSSLFLMLFPDKLRADEMAGGQGNVELWFWSGTLIVPQLSPPPPPAFRPVSPRTSRVLEGGPPQALPGPKALSKAV